MDILTRMMAELPLGYRELQALIATAPRRYKIYQIPKRAAGQFRTIAHPSRELKLIQRWLARKVLHALPIHTAAMAYRTGLSISDNTQKHLNQRYLLRLDIKNFFPSIKPIDFIKHCAIHFSPLDAKSLIILTQILFKRNPQTGGLELAIGAPSSPLISNSIFFPLDQKIS
jgi:RNA-directed DNA polymerase